MARASRRKPVSEYEDRAIAPVGRMTMQGALAGTGTSGIEVKTVGPTEADRTFFQSVRLKLGNNPLERPFAQHPIVYACVHANSSNISGTQFTIRPSTHEKAKPAVNELSALFDDPNPLMSTSDFFYAITAWLELSGECIIVKEGRHNRVGTASEVPHELWPLNGRAFKHVVNVKTRLVEFWILNEGTANEIIYKPQEIIQVKFYNPYDPYRGLAPLAPAQQSVMTDWMAALYNEAFFKNGGDPGGILMVEGTLTPTRRSEMEEKWADRHQGASKQKRLAVLDQGMKYESVSSSHSDMEFTKQREWSRNEILAVFRVPPAEAGFYEDVNYATAEVEARRYWTRTLFPIMRVIEDAMWSGLFRWVLDGRYIGRFNREAVAELQADLSKQLDAANKLKELGFTAEQIAAKVGLDMAINPWQKRAWVNGMPNDLGTLDDMASMSDAAETTPVPSTQFNGSQVTSAREIVMAVGRGEMAPEQAVAMIVQFFPGIKPEAAAKMVGSGPAAPVAAPAVAPVVPDQTQEPLPAPELPAAANAESTLEVAKVRTSKRTPEQRRIYWKELHTTHYGPQENKFQQSMRRLILGMRAESLALIETHPKEFKSGKVCLQVKAEDGGIDRMLFDQEKWKKKIGEASRPHYKKAILNAQKRLSDEIGAATQWSADDRVVENLTESLATRVVGVSKTIRTSLREALGDVVASGGGIREAQDAVKHVFKVSLSRSLTIARTEIGAASNRATFIAMREAGVTEHEWVSAGDELVRESHQIDGEVVTIGEKFTNGLRHPHDPEGDGGDVINCRCDVAPVVDGELEEGEFDEDEIELEYAEDE